MTLVIHQSDMGEALREPITLSRHRRRLSTIVKQQQRVHGRAFVVSVHRRSDWLARGESALQVNDETVKTRVKWKNILVGPDDVVAITYLPLGGGGGRGGGKAIGMALAMIALAVIAPMLIGALGAPFAAAGGGLTLLGKIASAGLVAGVGYFLSKAIQPKANKEDNRPVYGVSGGGNVPRPGDRIPVHYGRTWSNPDLSQNDYFYYSGEDQILLKRMTIGLGEYDIHTIRTGQAIMWQDGELRAPFENAEVEIIRPGELSRLVPGTVYSSDQVGATELPRPGDQSGADYAGPFVCVPKGKTTSRIQIDWSLPQGLYAILSKDGKKVSHVVGLDFEYSAIDEEDRPIGGWFKLIYRSVSMKVTRAQRFTEFFDVSEGRYAVRARNWNPVHEGDNYTGYDMVNWDGLRSHLGTEPGRPEVTELVLKIPSSKATGNIQFGDIWVEHTRKLPVQRNGSWNVEPTRKAVWAALDVLMNSTYGNATPTDKIDIPTFLHYAETLQGNDTFDGTIRGPISVVEALTSILGVIRAEPVLQGDWWTISRDEPRAMRKHLITRRQIVRDTSGVEYDMDLSDGSSDVIVEWYTDGDPKKRQEHRVTIGEQTLTPRRINLFGVSDFEHADMLARWYAAAAYYRREHRLFSTEMAGRNLARNDAALIDMWFLADAKAAGVESVDGVTVYLDADIPVPAGSYAVFRNETGMEWGPVAVGSVGERAITLHRPDIVEIETWTGQYFDSLFERSRRKLPVTVLIGTLNEITQPYIIKSARPEANGTMQISAVIDADEVWQVLGEDPPPRPPISDPTWSEGERLPVLPWISASCIQKATTIVLDWAVGAARGANWYVVDIRYTDAGDDAWENIHQGPALAGSYALEFREEVRVEVRAYALNEMGVRSAPKYTVTGLFKPVINSEIADLDIQIENLSDQLKYELSLISAEGHATLNEVRDRVFELSERIANAAATQSGNTYQQIDLVKVTLTEKVTQAFAAIEEERTTRITDKEAIALLLETLSVRLNGAEAQISDERVARIEQDQVLAQRTIDLQARMTNAETGVQNEATARQQLTTRVVKTENSITTMAGDYTALRARVTNAEGQISAQAVAANSLTTRVTQTEGRISAQAQQITALGTDVGDNTAELTVLGQSVDGVRVQWGVTGTINNETGGFLFQGVRRLDGSVAYSVGIHGDLFVDGSITGRKISGQSLIISGEAQVGSLVINNNHIQGGAVSQIFSVTGAPASVTINVRPGAKIMILASANGAQNSQNVNLVLYRSGSLLRVAQKMTLQTLRSSTDSTDNYTYYTVITPIHYVDEPWAGVHTYTARIEGGSLWGGNEVTLTVIELSK